MIKRIPLISFQLYLYQGIPEHSDICITICCLLWSYCFLSWNAKHLLSPIFTSSYHYSSNFPWCSRNSDIQALGYYSVENQSAAQLCHHVPVRRWWCSNLLKSDHVSQCRSYRAREAPLVFGGILYRKY